MKPELSNEEQVEKAIRDVGNALLENIEASKSEDQAKIRKQKARYTLQKAKERLRGIELDLLSGIIED